MAPPVAGYYAWYDAQAITGLNDGDTVTSWPDLSGNGRDLNHTIATVQYYKTTTAKMINGHPSVYLNPSVIYSSATFSVPQPFTICAVIRADLTSQMQTFGCGGDNVFLSNQGGHWTLYAGGWGSNGPASDTLWHVFTLVWSGASSIIRIDGTPTAVTVPTAGYGSVFALGSEYTGGVEWTGPHGEVILYPSALSTTDMASVELYLQNRWQAGPPAHFPPGDVTMATSVAPANATTGFWYPPGDVNVGASAGVSTPLAPFYRGAVLVNPVTVTGFRLCSGPVGTDSHPHSSALPYTAKLAAYPALGLRSAHGPVVSDSHPHRSALPANARKVDQLGPYR